jgi:hypothetical protein
MATNDRPFLLARWKNLSHRARGSILIIGSLQLFALLLGFLTGNKSGWSFQIYFNTNLIALGVFFTLRGIHHLIDF